MTKQQHCTLHILAQEHVMKSFYCGCINDMCSCLVICFDLEQEFGNETSDYQTIPESIVQSGNETLQCLPDYTRASDTVWE